jgi:threonine dehydrogenase-like Zn-dependent dehydrogenase
VIVDTQAATGRFASGKEPTVARTAEAFWLRRPWLGEIRTETLPDPGPDDVLVGTRYSGVSRGTETLVFSGGVPPDLYQRMRAPFQAGDFPGPVKYGYLNVGVVEQGPPALRGRTVFCLYPHQTRYVVPAAAVTVVPAEVPERRAVLAGTVETAVNALWDATPRVGDRISVIGAGMVGCSVAAVAARIPGVHLQLVDIDPARAQVAATLGVGFALPAAAAAERDLVFHASATDTGLQLGLDLLAAEGTLTELSWYGNRPVEVRLGGAFHAGRLRIRSSQVATVARPDRSFGERLALSLDLLRDPAFDALITGSSRFADLPETLAALAHGTRSALCHLITYEPE